MGDVPAPGTERLGDRYALYEEFASGGMATMHYGRLIGPVGFNRTVAIKRLHANFASDPEFVRMFVDEALLAARVRHPNVGATIDVVSSEGQLFLVMEYVNGESLRRLWKAVQQRGGRIPRRIAASIILGVLHGVHAAHEATNEQGQPLGLVHRDVSPQNVLVGTDGVARVIDFGIAKAASRMQTTGVGQLKGKPAYMAPEQIMDKPLSRQTDIYAVSVILWEMLTGARLFWAKTDAEIIHNVLSMNVDRPSARVPSLLPALDDVVLKGLARRPTDRYATAREMAKAVEDCIAPASASDVGEWVERIGGRDLRRRERRLKAIEEGSAQPVSVPSMPRVRLASEPSLGTPISQALPASPAVPDLAVPTRLEVPVAKARGGALANTLPLPMNRDASPESSYGELLRQDIELDSPTLQGDAPTLEVAAPYFFRGKEKGARIVSSIPAPATKKSGAGWVIALGALALLVGGGVWWLPSYALGRCIAAASRQGVNLTAQRVTLRPHAILLHGVHATVSEVPGLTASAAEVEIALRGVHAEAVVARSVELTLAGTVEDEAAKIRAWRAARPGDPVRIEAQAGHASWASPFGEGTQLEAWDVSAQLNEAPAPTGLGAQPNQPARDELHVLAPSVVLRVPRGSLGPWRIRVDRDSKSSHVEGSFDPAVPEWATARVAAPFDGPASVALEIPPSSIQRLGIPPDFFAPVGDGAMSLEAKLDVSTRNGEPGEGKIEGKALLVLLGARAGKARVPTGLRLDAALTSSPEGALAANGTLVVGASRGRLSGTIVPSPAGFHSELLWHPSPPSCPSAATPGGGAAVSASTFAVDTGSLAESGPKNPIGGCVMGLFPAP